MVLGDKVDQEKLKPTAKLNCLYGTNQLNTKIPIILIFAPNLALNDDKKLFLHRVTNVKFYNFVNILKN